jgi:Bifunctional DNA primase/polymerase, N-terminal/Family of unknown function (DUF5906)/Primase C terminal 2 (PriCT-2)
MTSFSNLTAALAYAEERGWTVFPAPHREKKSHKSANFSNGHKWGKTSDPNEIRRDFSRWPDADIGIPAGKENGFWVLEADTPEGHDVDGIANLRALEAEHGKLPVTLTVKSPSGSLHYYFKYPSDGTEIRNSASDIAPGIDVRGEGGMVIAPPSMRAYTGVYAFISDVEPVDAPDWLIEKVKMKEREPRERTHDDELDADASEIIAALAVIKPHTRDVRVRVGMALRHAELNSDVEDLFPVWDHWLSRCDDYQHMQSKVSSVWEGFDRNDGEVVTIATVYHLADEADPGWRDRHFDAVYEGLQAAARDPRMKAELRAEQVRENIEIGNDVSEPILPTIMTLTEMHDRLVYIGSIGAVADRDTGRIRKKEHAAGEYAASKHGKKKVPALKLWIESKKRVTVDVLTWVPGQPPVCRPPEEEGTGFNTWRGLASMDAPEDWKERAKPFLEHVDFLVPVESERERFLKWLAHIFQCPEVLPHTMYLMTTRTTGIGRNLLASILVRALRGHVAAGVSLPDLLDGGFTGRLSKKLLATVDEAREGGGDRRYQRAERLKSLLTEDYRHVNPKYGFQSVEKNCCRWLMFSNHDDAIPFDNSDRRVIVISNPTERKSDEYYARLYGMLDDGVFIASVRRWLETKDISDFRAGGHAPMNEAKQRALDEMMTETDRVIAEFKEDCGTELTSRSWIQDRVEVNDGGVVNKTLLTYAIRRAGMVNVGRRVRTEGIRHSVVIVKPDGKWTVEAVKKASEEALLKAMGVDPPRG